MADFISEQKRVDEIIGRLITQKESAIVREYAIALKSIRADLAKAYEKYAASRTLGGQLTYAEMAKYKRLESLEQNIFAHIDKITASNAVKLKSSVGQVYQESFYRTAFAIESEVQAKLSFGLLNPNTIQRAIDNPLDKYGAGIRKDSLGFLIRNSRNQELLKSQIKGELTQSLIRGQSYQDAARALKKRLDIGATNAARIASTEMHRTHIQGRLDSLAHAKAKGVDMVNVWVSTLDEVTRDNHRAMDGERANEKDKFNMPGVGEVDGPGLTGVAAEDIYCRCDVIGVIRGYEPEVRRARGDGIIPYTTYPDYAKAKGWPMFYKGPLPRMSPANRLAQHLLKKANQVEPTVTSRLKEIGHATGARMEGLDFRIKGEGSLTRKIESNVTAKGLTHKEAANDIGDALRYTYVMDEGNYSKAVSQIVKQMEEAGFTQYKFKNYWSSNDYRGINTNWIYKGQKMEVQFHTTRSIEVKERYSHAIYEKMRVTTDPEEIKKYTGILHELWQTVSQPTGSLTLP